MADTVETPFRKRLDAFIKRAKRIHKGDIEALHGTRVASRRLRELVPLLQLDPDTSGKLGRQLGRVTKRLGRVRELDVLLLVIEELSRDGGYSSTALK
ncbi:MAG: CHAD domain-containing protein, partial [Bryobacteraceae bacterium]